MSVDLLFEAASAASTPHLVFGEDATLRAVAFAVTMPTPSGGFVVTQTIPGDTFGFAVTMAAPGGTITCAYDVNLPDYLGTQAGAPWRSGAAQRSAAGFAWATGARLLHDKRLPWQHGERLRPDAHGFPWLDGARIRPLAALLPWQQGLRSRPASTGLPWRPGAYLPPRTVSLPWHGQAIFKETFTEVPWRDGRALRTDRRLPWQGGAKVLLPKRLPWRPGRLVLLPKRLPWQHGLLIETHGNNPWPPIVPPEPDPCYDASTHLVFDAAAPATAGLVFQCDYYTPGGPGSLVVVPIRRTYIVVNDVSLTIVGGAVLDPLSLTMSLDADSWTWRWSATLPGSNLAVVDTGSPQAVAASINGVEYRLVLETVARDRAHGRNEVRVSGRGRNAILDILGGTYGNSVTRTAAQLMDDALLVGGDGWTTDFNIDDWLVPADVWSHQGTAISALRTIAAAAGAYLQPHRTDEVVRVLPRYATAPWDWASVTPDIELPAAVTKRESIEWLRKADYNRVFVSGMRAGILAQVTRTGTAGDIVAPMVTDALITAVEAGRQRGLSILGDTGRQQLVTLSLPVLPEAGVIEPGAFIRYVDGAAERVGVVRSTSLESRFPTLTQTIGVETHAY